MKATETIISMDAKRANMEGDGGTGCVEGWGGLG